MPGCRPFLGGIERKHDRLARNDDAAPRLKL
jgi:hypothetical protein